MSKEEYLKGYQKEEALRLIRMCIAYRMTTIETLNTLKNNGCKISERTLRRFKQEIKEQAGNTVSEIYQNEIVNNLIHDVVTLEQIQRESWKEYEYTKGSNQKLKALSLIRNATQDKIKLYSQIPLKFKNEKKSRKKYDLDKIQEEIKKTLKN